MKIIFCSCRYARLAIQIGNCTHAQVNVQIDVEFGREEIRKKLRESLDKAEVTWLSDNN